MITDPYLSSSTITQPSHTSVKQVRRGVFQRRSNLTCVVWDEGSLIWLPALRLWQWRTIKLVSVESGHGINPPQQVFQKAIFEHLGKKITKVSPSTVYQLIPGKVVQRFFVQRAGLHTPRPWQKAFLRMISMPSIDGVYKNEPRVERWWARSFGTTMLICLVCSPLTFDTLSPCNCSVSRRLRPVDRGAAVALDLKVEDTVRRPDVSMKGFVGQKMRDARKIWKRSIS